MDKMKLSLAAGAALALAAISAPAAASPAAGAASGVAPGGHSGVIKVLGDGCGLFDRRCRGADFHMRAPGVGVWVGGDRYDHDWRHHHWRDRW